MRRNSNELDNNEEEEGEEEEEEEEEEEDENECIDIFCDDNENQNKCSRDDDNSHTLNTIPELTSYNGFVLGEKSKTSLFSTIENEQQNEEVENSNCVDYNDVTFVME